MKLMGIDIGTTSVKAAVFDEHLERQYLNTVDYTLETRGDRVEFDALRYWEIVRTELGNVTPKPDAVAVDTQCETLILTDEDGNPVRAAVVWLDNRAVEEAEIIESQFGRKQVYEVTGQPEITATWPACKLLWIRRHEPEIWAKTKRIFLLEDYILFKLTGRFVTEKTLQSSTIYFDIRHSVWWQEMLDFVGIEPKMLPQLCDSGVPIGEYRGIKVVTGAMDQVAGSIGAGVIRPGIVSEMTGTTMVVFSLCDGIPAYRADSIVPCHYNFNNGYCLLSWSPTAGMALKWFRNALCEGMSFAELDEIAGKVSPGCDGLVFLPYLCGSTMPNYNPDARGSFTGLTPEHTRAHFVRSIMESVACMLKSNLDYLGIDPEEIRSMGGGANSRLWCQMKADLTGRQLVTFDSTETACLGSSILAGVGAGVFDSVEEACSQIKTKDRYQPTGVDYREAYRKFIRYDRLLNNRE